MVSKLLFKQQHPLTDLTPFAPVSFSTFRPVFLQLAQAWQEVEVAKSRAQQLQDQVEELQEKVSVQVAGNHGDSSLLSELETSLEAAELGVSKEEVSGSLVLLDACWRPNLIFSIWATGGVC